MNPGLPAPGDLEPIPGQLALPGMPPADGGTGGFRGQLALPGLELPAPDAPGAGAGAGDDSELAAVAAELRGLDGDGSLMAAAIRGALDMLLDGQHTGRYRWDQLHKTEKTHAGTLVEIALARVLRLADGTTLDYTIAGADVDCKFSHRMGGWMIPPEADGQLMLLVQASDEDGTWSAGLVRAAAENLSPAGNRDGKRALNEHGRAAVRWFGAAAGERAVPAGPADAGQPDRGRHGGQAGRLHEAGPRRRRGARPAARRGHRDLRGLRRGPGARRRSRPAPARSGRVRQRAAGAPARRTRRPGLRPVHPVGGRRLAARLGRRPGRGRTRAPSLTTGPLDRRSGRAQPDGNACVADPEPESYGMPGNRVATQLRKGGAGGNTGDETRCRQS